MELKTHHNTFIRNKAQIGECGWSQWANVLLHIPRNAPVGRQRKVRNATLHIKNGDKLFLSNNPGCLTHGV